MADDGFLSFSGISEGKRYGFEKKLLKPIDWEQSEVLEEDGFVVFKLAKKADDRK